MGSVLNTIKKMLGLDSSYDAFDTDIIVFINSALMAIKQIGVNLLVDRISGPDVTWTDLLGERSDIESVKEILYLRVRRMFDPPSSSAVDNAMLEQIHELEWRVNVEVDTGGSE